MKKFLVGFIVVTMFVSLMTTGCKTDNNKVSDKSLSGSTSTKVVDEPIILVKKENIVSVDDEKSIRVTGLKVGAAYRIVLNDRDRKTDDAETGLVDMEIYRKDGYTTEGYEGPHGGKWYSNDDPAVFFKAQDDEIELFVFAARDKYVGTFRVTVSETDPKNVPTVKKETVEDVATILVGKAADTKTKSRYGIFLTGGVSLPSDAKKWVLEMAGGGGDFVFITTKDDDTYYPVHGFDSSRTLVLTSKEAANTDFVYNTLMKAEAVFFDGGDQSKYVDFYMGSKVEKAINYLATVKKIPIGGTSAGLHILGKYSYAARHNANLKGVDVLDDPYNEFIDIEDNFLKLPFLEDVITDSHFTQREREGRLIGFVGRIMLDEKFKKNKNVIGIGVDESTSMCIENDGSVTVFGADSAHIYIPVTTPETFVEGDFIEWNRDGKALKYIKLKATGKKTDLNWKNIRSYSKHGWISVKDGDVAISE